MDSHIIEIFLAEGGEIVKTNNTCPRMIGYMQEELADEASTGNR